MLRLQNYRGKPRALQAAREALPHENQVHRAVHLSPSDPATDGLCRRCLRPPGLRMIINQTSTESTFALKCRARTAKHGRPLMTFWNALSTN